MMLKDIYPIKAQFIKNEKIGIQLETEKIIDCEDYNKNIKNNPNSYFLCKIYSLDREILCQKESLQLDESGMQTLFFNIGASYIENNINGFGVRIELFINSVLKNYKETAFDVADSWKSAPRYGFISDFFDKDLNDEKDLNQMNKYHLNVVQYYDWMYRHHELLPANKKFTDILGRSLNIDVVKQKIDMAHKYGMKAMAYGAVYGAEKEFFDDHIDWAIHKNNGKVIDFINLIYIMDISRECGWHDHIINEFYKAVKFGFDGIHMDQYGFPKEALNAGNDKVRYLREDFCDLINDTKEFMDKKDSQAELIFNAVNNWPIDAVSQTRQAAMYIEVWSPHETFEDLYNLITNAKRYENKKQVILAAYMKPFKKDLNISEEFAMNATIMTMTTIFASGGFHLLLGENNGILAEAYYPDYGTLKSEKDIEKIRRYYDFIVRYEELLYSFDLADLTTTYSYGINGECTFSANAIEFSSKPCGDKVWTSIKQGKGFKVINLVNYNGMKDDKWNEPKEKLPEKVSDITITLAITKEIKGVYIASPDFESNSLKPVDFEYIYDNDERKLKFTVSGVDVWDLVYINL